VVTLLSTHGLPRARYYRTLSDRNRALMPPGAGNHDWTTTPGVSHEADVEQSLAKQVPWQEDAWA